MRKLRTALEVRFKVMLSFSAHSTGSLALCTSTATGSAHATPNGSQVRRNTSATAPTHPWRCAAAARARNRPAASGRCQTGLWRSILQHTIDIPGIGIVCQRGDVLGHLGSAEPSIERQSLAFPERNIETIATKRV